MKKNPALTVIASFILCYFTISCHKNQETPATPVLSISTSSLLIDSTIGSSDSFNVSANIPWKLTLSPSGASNWLQVSPTEGQSGATIRLTITGKNTNTTQPVTLSLQPTDGSNIAVQTITLSQEGTLAVDSSLITLPPASGNDSIHINTNLAWKATSSVAWLHLDTTQGVGPHTLKISADTNRTGSGQQGNITISPLNNSNVQPVSIQVIQYAYYIVYNFSPASGPVGTTVTLNGIFPTDVNLNFQAGPAAAILSHSATQIVCTVPQGAVGGTMVLGNSDNNQYACSSQTPFTLKGGWNLRSDYTAGLASFGSGAVTYNYNGTIYTCFGSTSSSSIYRLDTVTFHWTPDITIPANVPALVRPWSYVVNSKLYVGGATGSGAQSFWEYDLTQGNSASAWRQLTNAPDDMSYGYAFTEGGNGYVQTSQNTVQGLGVNNLYKFYTTGSTDPGTWTAISALNVVNANASGFTIGNTTYFGGGGWIDNTQVQAFNSLTPPSTTITAIAAFPENLNTANWLRAPGFTIGSYGYIYNYNTGNIYQYDPVANTWSLLAAVPNYTYLRLFAGTFGGRLFSWDYHGSVMEYIGQ